MENFATKNAIVSWILADGIVKIIEWYSDILTGSALEPLMNGISFQRSM